MKTLQKKDASINSSRAQANQPLTQGIGRPAVHGHFNVPAQLKKGVIQRVWFERVNGTITKKDDPRPTGTHKPFNNTPYVGEDGKKVTVTVWEPKNSVPKQLTNKEKMDSYPQQGIFEVAAADVMFSQNSIGKQFADGTSYDVTISKFKKDGEYIVSDTLKPIRVFKGKNDRLVSLDNRRLHCAKEAGIKVKCIWATEKQKEKDKFKLTSGKGTEGKTTIEIR